MLFASAGVLEHAGIKIPYFAFFAHDAGLQAREPPVNMLLAMGIAATLCVVIGVYPGMLYNLLPYDAPYSPYDMTHVLTQLQLLVFAPLAIVYLHRSGRYPAEVPSVNLDAEWFLRRFFPAVLYGVYQVGSISRMLLNQFFMYGLRNIADYMATHHGPRGVLARNWPTGSMVMWVAVLLAFYMFLYFP
jgi:multicomponent Na+:H+ antiporter subunit D